MSRTTIARHLPPLRARVRNRRAGEEREAREILVRELSDYGTPAERNDLELIVEASQLADRGEVAGLLHQQAYRQLFRAA